MKYTLTLLLLLATICIHAVEVGPYKVTKVVDGDTIKVKTDLGDQSIRILYIDTPESKDNSHGKAMPEGIAASNWLAKTLAGKEVKLWGPDNEIKKDNYGRILAIPLFFDDQFNNWVPINTYILMNGYSPYWRKYGDAPDPYHKAFLQTESMAKKMKRGAWKTAPQYMIDKANERTAPKDQTKQALKALNSAVSSELYKAELEKHPTHTHWLNGETRHNKDCQYFGVTKEGKFCTKDKGAACGTCGG